jgi:hypothetical protein
VLLEGLGNWKKFNDLIGIRIRDHPTCSTAPATHFLHNMATDPSCTLKRVFTVLHLSMFALRRYQFEYYIAADE